jgi:hypothetical protein
MAASRLWRPRSAFWLVADDLGYDFAQFARSGLPDIATFRRASRAIAYVIVFTGLAIIGMALEFICFRPRLHM